MSIIHGRIGGVEFTLISALSCIIFFPGIDLVGVILGQIPSFSFTTFGVSGIKLPTLWELFACLDQHYDLNFSFPM